MISETTIDDAVDRLVKLSKPQQIFLFGSYARGDADDRSDLDIMVVKRRVKDRRKEMVLMHDALRAMRIPVDILVASESTFRNWEDVVGTVFYEIKREGRLCYDVARPAEKLLLKAESRTWRSWRNCE